MNPTLDECNDVIDWLEDNFDFGRDLRARVREADGRMFVTLKWYRADDPRKSGIYCPSGWCMSDWWIDEDRNWTVTMFKAR